MNDDAGFVRGTTIGGLAQAAGVNVETIRFYQRKGLMPEPARRYGSVRRYTDADLARLRFIKTAQRLGFSLEEIGELLKLEDGTTCAEARRLGEMKLAEVRHKLENLRRMESALVSLVANCAATQGSVSCPLIGSLRQGEALT